MQLPNIERGIHIMQRQKLALPAVGWFALLQTKTIPDTLHIVCQQIFLFTKAQNDDEFTEFFVLQLAVYYCMALSCKAMRLLCKKTTTLWQLLQPIYTYTQQVAAIAEGAKSIALDAQNQGLFVKPSYVHKNNYIYDYVTDGNVDELGTTKGWGIATHETDRQRVYTGEMQSALRLKDLAHVVEACGHGVFQYYEPGKDDNIHPQAHKGKFYNGYCTGWALGMSTYDSKRERQERAEWGQWECSRISKFRVDVSYHKKRNKAYCQFMFENGLTKRSVTWNVDMRNEIPNVRFKHFRVAAARRYHGMKRLRWQKHPEDWPTQSN